MHVRPLAARRWGVGGLAASRSDFELAGDETANRRRFATRCLDLSFPDAWALRIARRRLFFSTPLPHGEYSPSITKMSRAQRGKLERHKSSKNRS